MSAVWPRQLFLLARFREPSHGHKVIVFCQLLQLPVIDLLYGGLAPHGAYHEEEDQLWDHVSVYVVTSIITSSWRLSPSQAETIRSRTWDVLTSATLLPDIDLYILTEFFELSWRLSRCTIWFIKFKCQNKMSIVMGRHFHIKFHSSQCGQLFCIQIFLMRSLWYISSKKTI